MENHFFKMKRDIGIAQSSKKERDKEWLLNNATQNDIHDTIPISLSVISIVLGSSAMAAIKYHLFSSSVSDKDIGMVSCSSMWLY